MKINDILLKSGKIIGYGYGQAFHVINQFLKLDYEVVVDNDLSKWGNTDGLLVIGANDLKKLNLAEYSALIFPFNNHEIIEQLISLGMKEERIYTLPELLRDNDFRLKYETYQKSTSFELPIIKTDETSRKLRYKRSEMEAKGKIVDCKETFKLWFESNAKFFYRNIDLKQVLAADISNILEYIYIVDKEITLHRHPLINEYKIYGDGEILVPMFAANRPDFINRTNSIISSILDKVTVITCNGYSFNNNPDKIFIFKYSYSKVKQQLTQEIVQHFEKLFFKLSKFEKEWFEYSINYYIQLIDFYIDTLKPKLTMILSTSPYYQQESILCQLGRLCEAVEIAYQHGNYYDLASSQRFHPLLYFYVLNSDYYLVWNEKGKTDLINEYGKKKEQIKVLGNSMQLVRKAEFVNKANKFLVILPGRVLNSNQKIYQLIDEAEFLSTTMNLNYDIRFHPLHHLNLVNLNAVNLNSVVSINDCYFDNYDFCIGMESTLIDEVRNGGYVVFNKVVNVDNTNYEYSNKLELLKLINGIPEINLESVNIETTETIRQRYSNFILQILQSIQITVFNENCKE